METLEKSNRGEKSRVMAIQYELLSLNDIVKKSVNIQCAVTSCGEKWAIWAAVVRKPR